MKPELKNRQAFESILENYSVSEEGQKILENLDLVVLFAPTSAGRNTIIDMLVESGKYEFIISDTTRPMRTKDGKVIEKNGASYFFRTEEEILDDLKNGLFIEAAIVHNQQVSGTSLRELKKASKAGKIPVLEVQQDGVHVIAREKPDADFIFILPPSFDEWMRRLKHRSDMTDEEIQNRLKSSVIEFNDALTQPYYKFVINDDVKSASDKVRRIVEQNDYPHEDHVAGMALVQELLGEARERIEE